jgi:biotin carboxyl carrier protein
LGYAARRWLVKYEVMVGEKMFKIEVTPEGQVWVDQRTLDVNLEGIDGLPLYSLLVDRQSYETHIEQDGDGQHRVIVGGRAYSTRLVGNGCASAGNRQCAAEEGPSEVAAPLPGLVVEVRATEDQAVSKGDVVVILESMKMHLELCASRDGLVDAVYVAPGREVGQGEILAVIS